MTNEERIGELEEAIEAVRVIMSECLQMLAISDQPEEEILSAAEIAKMLDISTYRVNEDLKQGKRIHGKKIGSVWAVLASQVPRYAEWVKNRHHGEL